MCIPRVCRCVCVCVVVVVGGGGRNLSTRLAVMLAILPSYPCMCSWHPGVCTCSQRATQLLAPCRVYMFTASLTPCTNALRFLTQHHYPHHIFASLPQHRFASLSHHLHHENTVRCVCGTPHTPHTRRNHPPADVHLQHLQPGARPVQDSKSAVCYLPDSHVRPPSKARYCNLPNNFFIERYYLPPGGVFYRTRRRKMSLQRAKSDVETANVCIAGIATQRCSAWRRVMGCWPL